MAERVTRKQLENMVELLAKRQNRSTATWTRVDGRNVANAGALYLEAHSPGDGWTRYRLMVITSEFGGQDYYGTSRGFTAREMYAYLRGALDALEINRYNPHS